MKTPRKPSPARSQGAVRTPIRHKHRRTLSVSSARSNASGMLTALVHQRMDSFVVSPLGSRKSILSDNTKIEEPKRKSWWKNLAENSRDVVELFEENEIAEPNNIIEELDMEVLSQENKNNCTLELPESSGSESIKSIVIPQRKLFTQKENQQQIKFAQLHGPRESLAKLHKTGGDKTLVAGTRELFQNKQRSRPIFPAALLNISPNKTAADKTKEFAAAEPKGQIRNIFGNRASKRKNIFTNFIVSESEDDIFDIQPKVFGFQKKIESRRRSSRGMRDPSPSSSITTDMEMDDWRMLPSSTMVENQLEVMIAGQSPKRPRLSKLTEIESEAGSNKSSSSKESRKSKPFTKGMPHDIVEEEILEKDDMRSRKSKTFTKEKSKPMVTEHNTSIKTRSQSKNSSPNSSQIIEVNIPFTKGMPHDIVEEEILEKDDMRSRKSKTFTKEKSKPTVTEHNTSIKTRSQSKNSSPNSSQIIEVNMKSLTANKGKQITSPKDNDNPVEVEECNDDELNFSLQYDNDNNEKQDVPEVQNKSQTRGSKSTTQNEIGNSSKLDKDLPINKIQNKSQSRASKSMTQMVTTNSSKLDKGSPNKNESPEIGSSQERSNRSLKSGNKLQVKDSSEVKDIEINDEKANQSLDASSRNDADQVDNVELKQETPNDSKDKCQDISQEVGHKDENDERNEREFIQDEISNAFDNEEEHKSQEAESSQEVEDEHDENEEENEDQHGSELIQDEIVDDSDNEEKDQSQEAEISQEVEGEEEAIVEDENDEYEEENEDKNFNDSDNEEKDQSQEAEVSQEVEDEEEAIVEDDNDENEEENKDQNFGDSDNEEKDKSQEAEISQEVEDEEEAIEQDSDAEENESGIQDNEEQIESDNEEIEPNESKVQEDREMEQNESHEVEGENEEDIEEAIEQDSGAEENESDIQDNEEQIENKNEENEEESAEDEVIETPNVSHDRTGRNRKKNESPEAVLHDSNNINDSFAVKGRNTSVRKTEMLKSIHPDLVPARESTGFSDGTSNSSGQGSGWDSHRTTRKTLRQTYGREFSPRKSLRALVMEKSAKRQMQHNELASVTAPFPQANSTEIPSIRYEDECENDENQAPKEVSLRTRQTAIDKYLQEVKKKNTEARLKMEEEVHNLLNAPSKFHLFKVPAKPLFARKTAPKPKQNAKSATKSTLLFGELPTEFIEDMKYKPPKRFQPRDAPWITKHLYKFLEGKLKAKYDYRARVRAEKLVEHVYNFAKDLRRRDVATSDSVDVLKREMARLDVVKTHHEFYGFFEEFMPREVRIKVIPDVVNKISLPRNGVFNDIL